MFENNRRTLQIVKTMAAICYSCDKGIMNNEFVGCAGVCGEIFHLKCVAVSKVMLNAINSCPNIHWYCHNCNEGNRHISAAIKNIDDSIARLTTSLSADLMTFLDGLRILMDNVLGRAVTMRNAPTDAAHSKVIAADPEDIIAEPNVIANDPEVTATDLKAVATEPKVIAVEPEVIVTDPTVIAADRKAISGSVPPVATGRPTKSIVVSNIAKDVSVDCLKNYLFTKLGIERTQIQLALLLPLGRNSIDIRFLQYKVTIPDDNYSSIMSPSLWPQNVRLRDFIEKESKHTIVSKDKFFCY